MATKCANCKRDNPEGTVICIYCGEPVDPTLLQRQANTREFGEEDAGENQPRWGSARFDEQVRLILRVVEQGQIIEAQVNKNEGIILGRFDPETGMAPDVDLTAFNAAELGVSRRHARLDIQQDSLRITDLGSANSTFLNGLRLVHHQPRILRDGDEIRLGHLKLQINFIESAD